MKTHIPRNPWHSPSRLALWVALPMAETPKIESRLKMLLDATRSRRAPTQRSRLTMLTFAAVLLVPLAMLRPIRTAQAAADLVKSQTSGALPIQLVGLTDATVPGGAWWDADGKRLSGLLPGQPFGTVGWGGVGGKTTVQPRQVGRSFAFQLPPSLRNVPVLYEFPDWTEAGLTINSPRSRVRRLGIPATVTARSIQYQSPDGLTVCGAAFPANLSRTSIRVGAASGPWRAVATVAYPFQRRKITPVVGQYQLTNLTISGNKFTVATRTPGTCSLRIIAVDQQGRDLPLPTLSGNFDEHQCVMTARLLRPSSQIRELRIEAKPFVWTEYKDVALQPQSGTEGARP